MTRTFDGVWNGRSDYAKYTLSSYNENRPSGFFERKTGSHDPFWPDTLGSESNSYTKAGQGREKSLGEYIYSWFFTGCTFDYDDLAALRANAAKKVTLVIEATLYSADRIAVDMKKNATGASMCRCDKDGTAIGSTLLGFWNGDSPNFVSESDGVCTFDLTNDVNGNFAGVPQYGYVWGCETGYKGITHTVEFNGNERPNTTLKHATLYVVTNERQSTLSFDANGGSGAPASLTGIGAEGACTLTVPASVPTKAHEVFGGWSLTSDGAAAYQPGDSITVNGDTTLYAVWNRLYVHFKYLPGEGGTGEYDLYPCRAGTTVNIVDVGYFVKKSGYKIAGYSDTDGGLMTYSIGDTYEVGDEDVTLYACWATASYTICYDANGGSGAPDAQTKTGNVPLTLSSTVPTKAGFEFTGWATDEHGAPVYQPGDTYETDADTTLYAQWEELGGFLHVATHQGMKTAKAYVMTDNGLVRASAYLMTEDGLKEGM